MIPPSLLGISATPRYGQAPALAPEELSSPGPTRLVTVSDGARTLRLRTLDTGGSGPPLVLVHGLSCYLGFWAYNVAPLAAAGFRVLALDLPGFGGSDRPDASYSPPWYASVLRRWLDALGLGPVAMLGHSMGGQIAMTLVLSAPERISRLVLAAPAGVETFSPEHARWMQQIWHEKRAAQTPEAEVRANFEQMVFHRPDKNVELLLEERVRLGQHPSFEETSRAVSRAIQGMLNHPVAARLGELRAPTLVLFGERDRMIPNPFFSKGSSKDIGEAARRAIPGARLVMLADSGHMLQHDTPDLFNRAVVDFLGRGAA